MRRTIFMSTRIGSALIAIGVFLAAGPLSAHHSTTANFDASKTFTFAGTLTKVDWRNPHIELSLDAKNVRGQVEAWVIEAASPSFFRGRNVGKTDFVQAIGQGVTVDVYRARDGNLYGSLLKLTFSSGKSVTSVPGQ